MISLIHPSRSRPDQSRDALNRWRSRAGTDDFEVIISLDKSDPQVNQYVFQPGETVLIEDNNSAIQAINRAAKHAKGDILIVVSDDSDCPQNWSKWILDATEGKSDFVLKTFDGVQNWIVTMPVIDRKYYDRFGYIYHPDYRHMFSDTHFTHVAHCLKRIIWRNDIIFRHNHPFKKSMKDQVNHRADATWNDGKASYLRHVRRGFDMHLNVLDILPNGEDHYRWLKHNMR